MNKKILSLLVGIVLASSFYTVPTAVYAENSSTDVSVQLGDPYTVDSTDNIDVADVPSEYKVEQPQTISKIKLFTVSGTSSSVVSGNYTYTVKDDGTVSITKYSGTESTLVVPSQLDSKTVSEIANGSFYQNTSITSVTIPDSVKTIGSGAFAECTNLASLSLGTGVESIDTYAFEAAKLTSVTLPKSVTSISEIAFLKCSNLVNINVAADNSAYSSQSGVLFNKDGSSLLIYPNGKAAGTYNVGNNVTSIGNNAFLNSKITGLQLPSSLKSIGDWCFDNTPLTSITIPDSVETLGMGICDSCTSLKTVSIGSGVKELKYREFEGCTALTSVHLSEGLTTIDLRSFRDCTVLSSINFPNTLQVLCGEAFVSCTSLPATIVLPENMMTVEADAFYKCNATIVYPKRLRKLADGSYQLITDVTVTGTDKYDYAFQVLDLLNQARTAKGLKALKMSTKLLKAAMTRAAENSVYYGHTRPDGTMCTYVTDEIAIKAENIAGGQRTPESIMTTWTNSSIHNANMMNASYTTVGIGCYMSKDGTPFWTQEFSDVDDTEATRQSADVDLTNTIADRSTSITIKFCSRYSAVTDQLLQKGQSQPMTIVLLNTGWDGHYAQLVPSNVALSYTNAGIASYSSDALYGINSGKTTLSASLAGSTASLNIEVIDPVVTLDRTEASINTYYTVQLNATVSPDNTPSKYVTWSSSNSAVASVGYSGLVYGKYPGTAVITATSNGKTAQCVVTVIQPVNGMSINIHDKTVNIGDSFALTVKIQPSYATNQTVIWKSTNESVATVSSTGVVTAVGAGKAQIVAYSGTQAEAGCNVTVVDPSASPASTATPVPTSRPSNPSTTEIAKQEMYRLYNPNSGEHFYTKDSYERDQLASIGWIYEGVGWTAPVTSNTPVYRMYNANAGDHHYTMNAGERDMLVSVGWIYEGIGWYSDDAQGVPLYRQYNPNAVAGAHNYTVNAAERDMLVSIGWHDEGIGWYGM